MCSWPPARARASRRNRACGDRRIACRPSLQARFLVAFFAVLWTKGFGPEDRELFKLRKDEVQELREAEATAEARDQTVEDVV